MLMILAILCKKTAANSVSIIGMINTYKHITGFGIVVFLEKVMK
jgi:hypothetical protein